MTSLRVKALKNTLFLRGNGKILDNCDEGAHLSFPHTSTQWIYEMEKKYGGFAIGKQQLPVPFLSKILLNLTNMNWCQATRKNVSQLVSVKQSIS